MTVYDLFRRWAKAGVWQRVHDALRDQIRVCAGRRPVPTAAIIDSRRCAVRTPCPGPVLATTRGIMPGG